MTSPDDTEPPNWTGQVVYVVKPIHKHKKSTHKKSTSTTHRPRSKSSHTHAKSTRTHAPKKPHTTTHKARHVHHKAGVASKAPSMSAPAGPVSTGGSLTIGGPPQPVTDDASAAAALPEPGVSAAKLAKQWAQDAASAGYSMNPYTATGRSKGPGGYSKTRIKQIKAQIAKGTLQSYWGIGIPGTQTAPPGSSSTTTTGSTSDSKKTSKGAVGSSGHAQLGVTSPVYHPPPPPIMQPVQWRAHSISSRHL
jgi:hypothetical protein